MSLNIQEYLDKYHGEDHLYNRSQLINDLKYNAIDVDANDYGMDDHNGIEEKISILSELVIELYVDKWENGELSDSELEDKLNIIRL